MNFEIHLPTEHLRPYIKSYTIVESGQEITNRVLPDTCFALAFRIRGQISQFDGQDKRVLPSVAFSGLKKSYRLFHYATHSAAIIVLFKETMVSAFLKHPLHELFEQTVSLDHFFSLKEISWVEERLAESGNNTSRIAVIEQFLLGKIAYQQPDKLMSEAISKIHAQNGNLKIKALANELYISLDAFEKRFRKATGASPKQFSHIVKMNAVIRQYHLDPSFPDIAFDHGFYDQPHYTKEFKVFTGQTPTDFLKTARYW